MRSAHLMPVAGLLSMLALSACVETQAPPAKPAPADECKASSYQGLSGQPESVLRTMMLPAGSRVIHARDAVTMDYRVDRLNVEIGEDGRIGKIGCY